MSAADERSWIPDPASGIVIRMQPAAGLCFELAELGEGDHLALCLHGFPELNFSWAQQMPLLRDLGYRVWAPNLRGYGASSRPRGIAAYRIKHLLGDIAALIDASMARKVTLVAHDWGGALAWQMAIRQIRPIERLVVLNMPHPACFARELRHWPQRLRSWYMAFFRLPVLPEWWLGRRDAAALRQIFRRTASERSAFPDAVLDVYTNAALRPGALTAMVNWYRALPRAPQAHSEARLAMLDVPTLIIWGEQDAALGRETLDGTDRYVRDLTIHRMPGVSHWVQQEASGRVNAILRQWLPRADQALADAPA